MPKLICDATGDEFFLPDDWLYWERSLAGPKHFVMVPNAEHSMITGILELLPAAISWANNVIDQVEAPSFTWDIADVTGDITVDLGEAVSAADVEVSMWHSETCNSDRRDFRFLNIDDPCTCGFEADGYCFNSQVFWYKSVLSPTSAGVYVDVCDCDSVVVVVAHAEKTLSHTFVWHFILF